MSDTNNDGGPAFPCNTENNTNAGACYPSHGMALRDYFAAKAMSVMATGAMRQGNNHVHREDFDQLAEISYEMADAMLIAREQ